MKTLPGARHQVRSGEVALYAPAVVVCPGARGFTLLEMIIVIITLSILAFYIGIPSSVSVNRVTLARQLVNDIRLAQSQAMNYNPSPGATVASTGASTYQVCTPSVVCSQMNLGNATVSSFTLTFDGYGATSNATIAVTLNSVATNIQVTGETGLVEVLP